MARVVLATIQAGTGSTEALNANFDAIAEALGNLVSRVGDTPNQMEADLDLNGHTLVNSGTSDDPNRLMSFEEMVDYVTSHSSGLVIQKQELQIATAAQTLFTLEQFSYVPGSNNLAIYVDGVRKFSPQDYAETSGTEVTFAAGVSIGAEVEFISNEFISTVILPSHTHPWTQITNVPVFTERWPTWDEVTSKPSVFTPDTHAHPASDITSGRLADARRGVYVQATQPVGATAGDLWFW